MPKGIYDRKPKPVPEEQTASEPLQELIDDRMKVTRGPNDRQSMLESMAKMDFLPHSTPKSGWEYIWERNGQLYSITVVEETLYPREEVSNESYGGVNQVFVTKYREGKMIHTNDPRRRGQVEPDPGPKVFCQSAGGHIVMTVEEFLDLVNNNRARAICLSRRVNR